MVDDLAAPAEILRTVRSGDVDLLVRRFGKPGKTPIVIIHGANYHDSHDWRGVAAALAADREVAVYDNRGYGRSSWSKAKDYTHEANVGDLLAVMDDAGWESALIAGAARGAAFAALAGQYFPQRVAGLALIDWIPNTGIRHPGVPLLTEQSIGNRAKRFATVADLLRATTCSPHTLDSPTGRTRFESLLGRDGDSYFLALRDPDFQNPIPLTASNWPVSIPIGVDLWASLAAAICPIQYIEASRSAIGILPQDRARLRTGYSHMRWATIDAGNDLVAEAPDALVDVIRQFAVEAIDHAGR